VVEQLIRNQ
jgi:uncharacterized protein (DUF2237 family)